jgi:hypothetical protein
MPVGNRTRLHDGISTADGFAFATLRLFSRAGKTLRGMHPSAKRWPQRAAPPRNGGRARPDRFPSHRAECRPAAVRDSLFGRRKPRRLRREHKTQRTHVRRPQRPWRKALSIDRPSSGTGQWRIPLRSEAEQERSWNGGSASCWRSRTVRLAAFRPETVGGAQYRRFVSMEGQVLNQRPEFVDC